MLKPDEGYGLAGRTRRVIDLLGEFESELLDFAAKGDPFTAGDALLLRQAEVAFKELKQKVQSEVVD